MDEAAEPNGLRRISIRDGGSFAADGKNTGDVVTAPGWLVLAFVDCRQPRQCELARYGHRSSPRREGASFSKTFRKRCNPSLTCLESLEILNAPTVSISCASRRSRMSRKVSPVFVFYMADSLSLLCAPAAAKRPLNSVKSQITPDLRPSATAIRWLWPRTHCRLPSMT